MKNLNDRIRNLENKVIPDERDEECPRVIREALVDFFRYGDKQPPSAKMIAAREAYIQGTYSKEVHGELAERVELPEEEQAWLDEIFKIPDLDEQVRCFVRGRLPDGREKGALKR